MNKTVVSIKSTALKYLLADGFSVIPVGSDKRPLLSSWKPYQERLPTEEEIASWWKKWPKANVGIVTGKISGITVVDVDIHKGGDAKPFPQTYSVVTGNGGLQLYYRYQEGLSVSANAYPQFPSVDIRSDGGYVVAPPSVIVPSSPAGKKRKGLYEIAQGGEFADFPLALFGTKKKRSLSSLVEVKSGDRNASIASLIGKLVQDRPQAKMKEIYPAIEAINRTYSPPLPSSELETTFQSIVKKELERQSSIPSPITISSGERIDISLRKSKSNNPYTDMTNALLVLRQHPKTATSIRFNEFKQEIEYNGVPLEETDILSLVYLLQSDVKLAYMSKDTVHAAIQYFAHENSYDEAKDWLRSLVWDKKPRLDTWLISATGVEDDADHYHRSIGAQWFANLVRRLLYPGSIFDYVLVLVGPQGIGKTSLFRILGGPWYKSYTGSVENKDFYLTLRGAAIIDLDEGMALYRSESIKIKSIITEIKDEYRAPYDRVTKKYPRRFVFSMSTNDVEPFRDVTGNRRYWTVDVEKKVDFEWLKNNRDQLFAEAYYAIMNDVALPQVPMEIAEKKQDEHLHSDEWTESIGDYLERSAAYCRGSVEFMITITEIYDKVLKGDRLERLDRKHEMRIGNILRREFGFVKREVMVENKRKNRYVLSDKRIEELKKAPLMLFEDELDKANFKPNA